VQSNVLQQDRQNWQHNPTKKSSQKVSKKFQPKNNYSEVDEKLQQIYAGYFSYASSEKNASKPFTSHNIV